MVWNIIPWVNQKNIEFRLKIFENKCAFVFLTASVSDIFPN